MSSRSGRGEAPLSFRCALVNVSLWSKEREADEEKTFHVLRSANLDEVFANLRSQGPPIQMALLSQAMQWFVMSHFQEHILRVEDA